MNNGYKRRALHGIRALGGCLLGALLLLLLADTTPASARVVRTFSFQSFPSLTGELDQITQSDLSERITLRLTNRSSQSYSCDGVIRFRNISDGRLAPVADVYNSATVSSGTFEVVAARLSARSSVYLSPNDVEVSCALLQNPARTPTARTCSGTRCNNGCCNDPNYPICDAANNQCLSRSGPTPTATPRSSSCSGTRCNNGCCNNPNFPICDAVNDRCLSSSNNGQNDGGGSSSGGGCQIASSETSPKALLLVVPGLLFLGFHSLRRRAHHPSRSWENGRQR